MKQAVLISEEGTQVFSDSFQSWWNYYVLFFTQEIHSVFESTKSTYVFLMWLNDISFKFRPQRESTVGPVAYQKL